MVKGSDGETCCRLLILEATPGSLAEARLAWPSADGFTRALSETQGVADQTFREKSRLFSAIYQGRVAQPLMSYRKSVVSTRNFHWSSFFLKRISSRNILSSESLMPANPVGLVSVLRHVGLFCVRCKVNFS